MGITESEGFDIRYTFVDEASHLLRFFKTEGMLHWYPPSDETELENFIRIWMGFCRYSAALTATYENNPVGMGVLFFMPYRKVAHQCQFQVIVDPKYQRRGVGKALVNNLIHLAKTYFRMEILSAEVLDESPLIPLLFSLGFHEFGRQKAYVKEGKNYSPRILMEKEL